MKPRGLSRRGQLLRQDARSFRRRALSTGELTRVPGAGGNSKASPRANCRHVSRLQRQQDRTSFGYVTDNPSIPLDSPEQVRVNEHTATEVRGVFSRPERSAPRAHAQTADTLATRTCVLQSCKGSRVYKRSFPLKPGACATLRTSAPSAFCRSAQGKASPVSSSPGRRKPSALKRAKY